MNPAGSKRNRRRGAGELENEVLAALWAAENPLTPREVQHALGEGLAYNTVQTILTRLHAKGAVQREPAGRAHAYTPVLATRFYVELLERRGGYDGYGSAGTHVRLAAQRST